MSSELKSETKQVRLTPSAKMLLERMAAICKEHQIMLADGSEVNETSVLTFFIEMVFMQQDKEQACFEFLSRYELMHGFTREPVSSFFLRNNLVRKLNGFGKY